MIASADRTNSSISISAFFSFMQVFATFSAKGYIKIIVDWTYITNQKNFFIDHDITINRTIYFKDDIPSIISSIFEFENNLNLIFVTEIIIIVYIHYYFSSDIALTLASILTGRILGFFSS